MRHHRKARARTAQKARRKAGFVIAGRATGGGVSRRRLARRPTTAAALGRGRGAGVDRADVLRQLALGALHQVVADLAALLQGPKAFHLDGREMCEDVFAAALRFDESEAFGVVEPLDCPEGHTPPPVVFSADSGWGCRALSIRRWTAGRRERRGVSRTRKRGCVATIGIERRYVTQFRPCGLHRGLNMPSLQPQTVNSIE